MLGVTGILVGAVFLASIFMQTVLGYSALRTGVAFLPFALAITVGTVMARHLLARLSPRAVAAPGLVLVAAAAGLLTAAPQTRGTQSTCCPGSSAWAWGWAVSSPPISVSSMAGIPASHAGVASRFLMTGHEIKAALGVAVLSAVASTAGSLATQAGDAEAFARRFVAAAGMAALFRRSGHAPHAGGANGLGDCGYAHALR